MGNYAHLLENNKNGDKGKHANNGSRVQRDTLSKVRVAQYCILTFINLSFVCFYSSFNCHKQKTILSFANNLRSQAKFTFYRMCINM